MSSRKSLLNISRRRTNNERCLRSYYGVSNNVYDMNYSNMVLPWHLCHEIWMNLLGGVYLDSTPYIRYSFALYWYTDVQMTRINIENGCNEFGLVSMDRTKDPLFIGKCQIFTCLLYANISPSAPVTSYEMQREQSNLCS